MYTFSELLKSFRVRRGLTQREFAAEVPAHRNTIGDWERGNYLPGRDTITQRLADILHLSERELNQLLAAAGYSQEAVIDHPSVARIAARDLDADQLDASISRTTGQRTSGSQPQRKDFYSHITLPPNYVDRTETLKRVRDELLRDSYSKSAESRTVSSANALHGMGGVGKSVVARVLCDDPRVRDTFPDGILWATLGQSPEISARLREWISALGGVLHDNSPTLETLKSTLGGLLRERRCLLIVDDAWMHKHVDVFRVGGTRCSLLITTRDAEIARAFGMRITPIPPMAEDEAIRLLEEWADGQLQDIKPWVKAEIVERMGFLPLAVKLAGAQLRRKEPLSWLAAFDLRQLSSTRPETIHDNLEWTFTLSLDVLEPKSRHLYVTLAIFSEPNAISETGILRLWRALGGLNADETADLIADLAARALLEVTTSTPPCQVKLHALLRDFVAVQLGDRAEATHRALLDAFRSHPSWTDWSRVSDDGYVYDHLIYHLSAAGLTEDLKGLFASQAWMQARFEKGKFTYEGYLTDLENAGSYMTTHILSDAVGLQSCDGLSERIRYLLIRVCLNSGVTNFLPELVAQAVKTDLWTARRALSVAEHSVGSLHTVKICSLILKTGKLNDDERDTGVWQALESTMGMNRSSVKVEALVALLPNLNEEECHFVIDDGLEAIQTTIEYSGDPDDHWNCLELLALLAPHLVAEKRNESMRRGIEMAWALWEIEGIVPALEILAPHLPTELLDECIETLIRDWEDWLFPALGVLAPYLPPEMLDRGLGAGFAADGDSITADGLDAVAPYLSADRLEQAIRAAELFEDEEERSKALQAVIPYLAGSLLERARETIRSISSQDARIPALAEWLHRLWTEQHKDDLGENDAEGRSILLSEEQRSGISEQDLVLAIDFLNENDSDLFAYSLPPEEQRLEAASRDLNVALEIKDERKREEALAELAPRLSGRLLERSLNAFSMSGSNQECQKRAEVLLGLALHLPPEQRTQVLHWALETALQIGDSSVAEVLAQIVPYLTDALIGRASVAAWSIKSDVGRARVLATLAGQLVGDERSRALDASAQIALAADHVNDCAKIIAILVPNLDPQHRIVAVSHTVRRLTDEKFYDVRALEAIAPYLSELQLSTGLRVVRSGQSGETRVRGLLALALQFGQPERDSIVQEALNSVMSMENEYTRCKFLVDLAPLLGDTQAIDLIDSALKIKKSLLRAEVLTALSLRLPDERRNQIQECALEAAFAIDEDERQSEFGGDWDDKRKDVLVALVPQLVGRLLECGLKSVQALRLEMHRAEAMAAFLPVTPDRDSWLKAIRKTIVNGLPSIEHWDRESLFIFYPFRQLFRPPILSHAAVYAVASHIVEICDGWRW